MLTWHTILCGNRRAFEGSKIPVCWRDADAGVFISSKMSHETASILTFTVAPAITPTNTVILYRGDTSRVNIIGSRSATSGNPHAFMLLEVSDRYRSSAEAASEQLRLMKEVQLLQGQLKRSTTRCGREPRPPMAGRAKNAQR